VAQDDTIERFYREHASSVFAFLVSLCRDRSWAEDLMHDTFVKATLAMGGYRGGSPKAWLFAIARNVFLDDARRRRPVPTESIEYAGVADSDTTEVDAIERTLLALPQRQRQALVLSDHAGLTPAEVGATLQITPGAARVLIHRARHTFRALYEQDNK
jgi:RNA polymerase sigma-70 factor (ECF subfamily)